MTRAEHLQWCKDRAMEYCNAGDLTNAFNSFMSDIRKHDETSSHVGIELGSMLYFGGKLNTAYDMERWIQGFS